MEKSGKSKGEEGSGCCYLIFHRFHIGLAAKASLSRRTFGQRLEGSDDLSSENTFEEEHFRQREKLEQRLKSKSFSWSV